MSGSVVELHPHRIAKGDAVCLSCRHEWVHTEDLGPDSDSGAVWLECPACGLRHGRFMMAYHLPPGDLLWACNCGNDLFHITPDEIFCPHCGSYQDKPGTI